MEIAVLYDQVRTVAWEGGEGYLRERLEEDNPIAAVKRRLRSGQRSNRGSEPNAAAKSLPSAVAHFLLLLLLKSRNPAVAGRCQSPPPESNRQPPHYK